MAPAGKHDVAIVAAFAAAVRTLVVVLTAVFANVSAPHDSSASLDPSLPAAPGRADLIVQKIFSPLGHWDGVFFLHLAEHGYTYEMFHAFFPGLPLAMRLVASILSPILSAFALSQRSILLISGAIFTYVLTQFPRKLLRPNFATNRRNACSVGACIMLYYLTRFVLNSRRMALVSCILFALSPMNVFASAVYSEGPFVFASFTGMYLLESVSAWSQQAQPAAACVRKQTKRMPTSAALGVVVSTWAAGAMFSFAGLLRSNGLLLVGYLAYTLLRLGVTTRGPARSVQWFLIALSTVGAAVLAVTPYVLYQLYGKYMYCEAAPPSVRSALHEAIGVVLPGHATQPDRPWCADASGAVPALPNMYGFIQAEYWGVGPFAYYVFKQIPQFILASPVLAVSFAALNIVLVEGGGRCAALLGSMLKGLLLRTTTENADPPTERDSAATATAVHSGRSETDRILQALDAKAAASSPARNGGKTRAVPSDSSKLPPLPPIHARQVTAGSVSGFVSPRHEMDHSPPRTAPVRKAPALDVSITSGDLLSHKGLPPPVPLLEPGVLPYAAHLLAMALVALVIMHVQVATRFLSSSSPLIYWYLAHVWTAQRQVSTDGQSPQPGTPDFRGQSRSVQCCSPAWRAVFWLCLYTVLGPLLFGNFYNWT